MCQGGFSNVLPGQLICCLSLQAPKSTSRSSLLLPLPLARACTAAASTEGDEAVQRIAKRYTEGAKLAAPPKVFQGSSMGAVQFGALQVQLAMP